MLKIQTAMEFLITYGWAVMIIAVVLASIAAIGVFNLGSFAKNECVVGEGFSCGNFFLSDNGLLTVNIFQSLQDPINVTEIGCNQGGVSTNMQAPYNPPSNQEYITVGGNYTFGVFCYTSQNTIFTASPGGLFSGYLVINYTDEVTGETNQALGKLVVKTI